MLARALGDQHRLARIATFMVDQCETTGDYNEAVRFGQEALSIARTLGDRSIEVAVTYYLGRTHASRGESRPWRSPDGWGLARPRLTLWLAGDVASAAGARGCSGPLPRGADGDG